MSSLPHSIFNNNTMKNDLPSTGGRRRRRSRKSRKSRKRGGKSQKNRGKSQKNKH